RVQAEGGDAIGQAAGEDLPAGAEAGVQGAVGGEPSQRALNRPGPDLALPGRAGHQDLSIRLNQHGAGELLGALHRRGKDLAAVAAAGAEAGVKGAVGVESGYREREGPEGREARGILTAHPDDLSVRLEGDALQALAADEAGGGQPAAAERGVQLPGGQEPRYAGAGADHDVAVGLHDGIRSATAGGQHLPTVAECRIQAARRAICRGLRLDQDRFDLAADGRRWSARGSRRGATGRGATGRRGARRSGGDTAGDGHGGKADAGDDDSSVSHWLLPERGLSLATNTGSRSVVFTRAGGH